MTAIRGSKQFFVRRKYVFDPIDLFQGGTYTGIWFDPTDITTLRQDKAGTTVVTADSDPVGNVANKVSTSGGAVALDVDNDTTKRPLYKTNGGYPALRFDGGNDSLRGDDALLDFIGANFQDRMTFVIVLEMITENLLPIPFNTNNAQFNSPIVISLVNTAPLTWRALFMDQEFDVQGLTVNNKYVLTVRLKKDGSNPGFEMRVNGVTSNSAIGTVDVFGSRPTFLSFGNDNSGNRGFDGNIYQLYWINTNLSDTDLSLLEKSLGAKAGISL